MRRTVRLDKAASLAFMIAALLGAAGFISATRAVAATGPAAITDPSGDVINRDTNAPLTSPATDIVAATVDSGAGGIVLTFRTQQMGDPATDPNWASLNTFVSWQIDSNGDGKVDDLIRYSADRSAPGGIAGDLTHWSGPGIPAKHCDAAAAFSPTTGYSLTFDPACIGNPASINYRVQLTYDTDLAPTKPVLAFDVAPNTGLAGPVPIVIPTAATAAPPAGGAPAPAASAPSATPGGAPAPGSKPPAAKPATAAAKPAPKPAAKPAAPVPVRPAAAAPASAPTAPAAPADGSKAGGLAATGTNSTRWLAGLGGVFLLLGGLSLMADRRQGRTA